MPQCASEKVVCNGSYETKNKGLVKRLICRSCGHTWSQPQNASRILAGAGVRDSEATVLQAFALVALGLPLEQVGGLVDRKSETITTWLQRCFAEPGAWRLISDRLISECGLLTAEVKDLTDLLKQVSTGEASFHAKSRRKPASKIRTKRKRHRKIIREEFVRRAAPRQLTEDQVELYWRGYQRFGGPDEALDKQTEKLREKLKVRIEHALGERVAVTSEGEFFRFENDSRVTRWVKELQEFNPDGNQRRQRLLSQLEQMVFDQVRNPNGDAHFYARDEALPEWNLVGQWPEKMTPNCLAQGLGMPLEMFISTLKSIARLLRSRPK
jgi:hypothetical protein